MFLEQCFSYNRSTNRYGGPFDLNSIAPGLKSCTRPSDLTVSGPPVLLLGARRRVTIVLINLMLRDAGTREKRPTFVIVRSAVDLNKVVTSVTLLTKADAAN